MLHLEYLIKGINWVYKTFSKHIYNLLKMNINKTCQNY